MDLGLVPHRLSDTLLDSLMDVVMRYRHRVRESTLLPQVNWRNTRNPASYHATSRILPNESGVEEMLPIKGAQE